MTELEKAEKLRDKANVTFAEAKEALDNSGGDILDALIYLEDKGKATTPAGGGFFSGTDFPGKAEQASSRTDNNRSQDSGSGEDFSDLMKRFGAFCLKLFNKSLSNYLNAAKGDRHLFSCPVLIVALLLLFFFWITIPLFIISLFCGVRYRFSGEDLGKESVNNVMDNASTVVNDVKKSIVESASKSDDKNKEQHD